jgi:hypothetical protein
MNQCWNTRANAADIGVVIPRDARQNVFGTIINRKEEQMYISSGSSLQRRCSSSVHIE